MTSATNNRTDEGASDSSDGEPTHKPRSGRPPYQVTVTEDERKNLEALIRRSKAPQSHVTRAKIALMAADGSPTKEIVETLGVSTHMVCTWRRRFSLYGVSVLEDAPRSGAPRTYDDDKIAEIIHLTLQTEPKGATHWSTSAMADKVGMSKQHVSRVWRAFGLKPHLVQYYTISNDPDFAEKVRDVVGLYLNPPEAALVLCVDEKTQIQALNRTQPILPLGPGVPERRTTEYVRNGTTNLYAALEMASGKVITKMTRAHRALEFIAFLEEINRNTPKELDLHLILDNYATHKTEAVRSWLLSHPRFHLHFTPTYSSWMNLVERWFSELTTKLLRRSAHRSVTELTRSIEGWAKTWNENPRPYRWTKSADEIFASMEKYLRPIIDGTSEKGH